MLAASPAVWAQSQSSGSGAGTAAVLSGGVGSDARDQLAAQAKDYNVKLIFALSSGEYLSDINVDITDASGRKVVDHVSNGPWMFAQLPPGNYTVSATLNGRKETRKISVGKQGQKVVDFRWPTAVANLAPNQ
jgi:hypothetical protein